MPVESGRSEPATNAPRQTAHAGAPRVPAEPGRGGWRPLASAAAGFAGVLLLAAGIVGGYQVAFADRVYPGVTAFGVDVGGQTRDDARAALAAPIDVLLAQPVTLEAADTRRTTT